MSNLMLRRIDLALGAIGLSALVLAGCSSGPSSMPTSSLFGGSSQAAPVAKAVVMQPATPTERTLYAAATSARAERCGFNFDPAAFKASFFNYEGRGGTPPDQLADLQSKYDRAHNAIAGEAGAVDTYCSDDKVKLIRASLTKMLAGDFSAPEHVVKKTSSFWEDFTSQAPVHKEVINPEIFSDPSAKKVIRKSDDE